LVFGIGMEIHHDLRHAGIFNLAVWHFQLNLVSAPKNFFESHKLLVMFLFGENIS